MKNFPKLPFLLVVTFMKSTISFDTVSNIITETKTSSNLRGHTDIFSSTKITQERTQTKPCKVIVLSGTPLSGNTSEDSFVCELDPEDSGGMSGLTVPFEVSPKQDAVMRSMLENDEITSGLSTFMNPNDVITNNEKLFVPPDFEMAFERRQKGPRNLAIVTGAKPVLAVRVTATDHDVNYSAQVISDKIFGTNGDPVNLASQLNACSMNQLHITTDYSVDISSHIDATGVISVNIPIPLQGNKQATIRNAITTAVQNKLGFDLPGPFHHVMYIVQGCYHNDCGWAAYAYVNSWLSVYKGHLFKYTGVQVHEFGHNLNLAHSGMGSATYTDHTCMMGNPLYSDNVGRMCYNAAKNWQIGWYDNNKLLIDPRVTSFTRTQIVGIADYLNNPNSHPVVIKIETGTQTDHFIGFNRATGVNADNDLCDDCVTVYETGKNGEHYSQSWNLVNGPGGLRQGQEYKFTNWQGLGNNLVIFVHEINLSASPGYADVSISLSADHSLAPTQAPTPPPSSSPTNVPTRPPTLSPTNAPTQAPTPFPTSSPTNTPTRAPTPFPTNAPTRAPTSSPTFSPTDAPTQAPTSSPTSSPTNAPTQTPTASPTFSPTDAPTQAPTSSPTSSPTNAPTQAPTASPTFSPTHAPTQAPTSSPTSSPTDAPTSSPTSSPTNAPTKAPTSSPTSSPTDAPTQAPIVVPALAQSQSQSTSQNSLQSEANGCDSSNLNCFMVSSSSIGIGGISSVWSFIVVVAVFTVVWW